MANPNPLRLSVRDRPESKLSTIHYADINLRTQGDRRQPPHLIKLARHHVIPWETLRDFWNHVARHPENFKQVRDTLISRIDGAIDRYPLDRRPRDETDRRTAVIGSFKEFHGKIKNQANPFHGLNQDDDVPHLASMLSIYAWLPGNLFLGPDGTHRTDDPGSKFESSARKAIGEKAFERLRLAHDAIAKYQAHPDPMTANQAGTLLGMVAEVTTVADLNPDAWVRDGEKRDGDGLVPAFELAP